MTAHILNGRQLADHLQGQLALLVQAQIQAGHPPPGLAIILANDHPASRTYIHNKQKACARIGCYTYYHELSSPSASALLSLIDRLNNDTRVHGILVQLPLPDTFSTQAVLERIDPAKDVDGFHPINLGRLAQRQPVLRPCTPYGIMQLLAQDKIPIQGKHAVILGASTIVGRPMALEMLMASATVTVCHRSTTNLQRYVEEADILIIATGTRGCVDPQWLQPHQVVVDVGMHQLPDGKLCGDLDFEQAKHRVAWITPVPGGVGPMTVTALLQNTCMAAYKSILPDPLSIRQDS